MSFPALRALRERFPRARIVVMARPWVADLYRREPFCDELILCPPLKGPRGWAGALRTARELRSRAFDCAILLPNAFEAALLARLARIPHRIGYDRDGRGYLLSGRIAAPKPGEIPPHERFYYLELLRRAGILDCLPAPEAICLHGAGEARRAGRELFRDLGFDGEVIGLSPGAQNSRAKQWLPERFVEAAVRIAETRRAAVAIFGSARERPLCQAIAEAVRKAGRPVLSLAGETTLAQFIELAAACRVFVTNDSGAMHVASALGTPTVAIFGPTILEATAPAGPCNAIVREPVECSPCMLRDCPADHRCMMRISAARVADAALELVK